MRPPSPRPSACASLTSLAVLALALGCTAALDAAGAPAPDGPAARAAPPPPPGDHVATVLLSLHNAARASASPTPSPPLPALVWSSAAARAAQAWASGCSSRHDPALGSLRMGQNLFAVGSTSPSVAATPADAVGSWVGEAESYHHATDRCDSGKTCGHYTAVVWRSTTAVGCGHQVCTTRSPFGSTLRYWDFWVCNYVPPGNVSGQRPY